MLWKVAMLSAVLGWFLLLLVDGVIEGVELLRSGFRAVPPPRRYPAAFFAVTAAPPVALSLLHGVPAGVLFAGAGGGLAGGAAAMVLNRLAGRWWRLCLSGAAAVVLVGYGFFTA